MSFKDGFYKIAFTTPLGQGFGVAYLHGGQLHGGDTMMAYLGNYSSEGDQLAAEVRVFAHSVVPGMKSVLGPTAATLNLTGHVDGNGAMLSGAAPQAPHINLSLRLDPLAD